MLREQEKQKYGYGEAVDYTPLNFIPTAVDALVRLVLGTFEYDVIGMSVICDRLGVTESSPVSQQAQDLLTALLRQVFPTLSLIEIEDAFEQRSARAYLYL